MLLTWFLPNVIDGIPHFKGILKKTLTKMKKVLTLNRIYVLNPFSRKQKQKKKIKIKLKSYFSVVLVKIASPKIIIKIVKSDQNLF